MPFPLRRFSLVASLVLLAPACSPPTAPDAVGSWGGPFASLVLTAQGGTVTYLCGAGTIDSGWTLTSDGGFEAVGQHFFGGGPAPTEGRPPHPARYAGLIRGNTLTLTVTVTDLDQTIGPFELKRGGPPVEEVCV